MGKKEIVENETIIEEKNVKSKKETKKTKKDTGKTLCIVLLSLILIISGTFGLTLTLTQVSKNEVKKMGENILKNVNLKKENSITFQNNKITYGKIKLDKIPKEGNVNVDKNGNVAISINNGKWCAIKEYYSDNIEIIKYTKESCTLSEQASKVIEKNVKENIVETEKDSESSMKSYFNGSNPNNYLVFAERCFRVIGITKDENIKIIYEGYADNNQCENNKDGYSVIERISFNTNNNWYDEKNTVRTKLESYIKDKNMNKKITFTDSNLKKLVKEKFYVGAVNRNDNNSTMLKNEKSNNSGTSITKKDEYSYESYIGMITASDFINASSSDKCTTMTDAAGNPDHPCSTDNYLFKEGYPYWTASAVAGSTNKVWRVSSIGTLLSTQANKDNVYIRPVLVLNKNVALKGKGTSKDPFIVE